MFVHPIIISVGWMVEQIDLFYGCHPLRVLLDDTFLPFASSQIFIRLKNSGSFPNSQFTYCLEIWFSLNLVHLGFLANKCKASNVLKELVGTNHRPNKSYLYLIYIIKLHTG